jgi:hypothetical protein
VLPPDGAADAAMLSLVPEGVAMMPARGLTGAWIRSRWWGSAARRRLAERAAAARGSFWLEWHKEIRRHVGDERLPVDLRGQLREHAHRSLSRSSASRIITRFPRRLLHDRVRTTLPFELKAEASAAAVAAGIPLDAPLVAIDVRRWPETLADAMAWLEREGYFVVRIDEESNGGSARNGSARNGGSAEYSGAGPALRTGAGPALRTLVMLTARFVICDSLERQHLAYLTGTPTLLINARDPFTAYPVRADGLFTMATAIDLDSGRELASSEWLEEAYFRSLRTCGYRATNAADVLAAAQEMHEGVSGTWRDSPGQIRFRERATAAGTALAGRVPLVAEWGPDTGFLGNGRLARVQADRWSVAS